MKNWRLAMGMREFALEAGASRGVTKEVPWQEGRPQRQRQNWLTSVDHGGRYIRTVVRFRISAMAFAFILLVLGMVLCGIAWGLAMVGLAIPWAVAVGLLVSAFVVNLSVSRFGGSERHWRERRLEEQRQYDRRRHRADGAGPAGEVS